MKHTPGPWLYQEKSDAYTHIVRGPSGQYVAGCCGQCSHGECEANARLIAAAPELLKAVELAHEFFINPHKFNPLDVERRYEDALIKAGAEV